MRLSRWDSTSDSRTTQTETAPKKLWISFLLLFWMVSTSKTKQTCSCYREWWPGHRRQRRREELPREKRRRCCRRRRSRRARCRPAGFYLPSRSSSPCSSSREEEDDDDEEGFSYNRGFRNPRFSEIERDKLGGEVTERETDDGWRQRAMEMKY